MSNELEKKLLLLVDDDPTNIKIVHAILEDNYKIRAATNGAKALDLAKTKPVTSGSSLTVLFVVKCHSTGVIAGFRPRFEP